MSQRFWGLLALCAVIVAVVLAVVRPGGLGSHNMAGAEEGITISIDMDTSDGPCTDIDSSANHTPDSDYTVAICVQGLGAPIGVATFHVTYNDTLNTAPEVANSGKGLDDNPDANAGTTTWGDGLGTNFDCSGGGSAFPMGDKNPSQSGPGKGDAFISCMDVIQGPWTFGDNETAGVMAVISFHANAAGTDTLTINNGLLGYTDSTEMGSCNPSFDYPMTCIGGSNGQAAATNTPTPTLTNTPPPTVTFTPVPPTATFTPTPLPPTPTFTPTPLPPTPTFTPTPLPPTATFTPTPVPPTPTFTPVPPTPTFTPVPPTPTFTPVPPIATSTFTPVPPTATFTPVAPTSTWTPKPTSTFTATPMVGPTATPVSGCPDLDGDGKVTGRDVSVVARALFTQPGQRRWNPVADLDHDGNVDLHDLFLVIRGLQRHDCRR